MPHATRPGDVLADRYRLVDLLSESGDGRFWRAHDRMLERHVAVHVIRADDDRVDALMAAARRSATVLDPRILRVLDADVTDRVCYVVNEWGWGASLDIVAAGTGPIGPRRAAWLVSEVADSIATAHRAGVVHGRLNPENVLIDRSGRVRIIGLCVDAALHGVPELDLHDDVTDLAGLLYCALTARWGGQSGSIVTPAPQEHGEILRPRRVRAGIPRALDSLCDEVLHPASKHREPRGLPTDARGIADYLAAFVGDPTGMAVALLASTPPVLPHEEPVVLPQVPELTPFETAVRPAETAESAVEPAVTGASGEAGEQCEPDDTGPVTAAEDPGEGLPTEAGLPIFGPEGDDVSWLERRTSPAPPPPPFESPPERPLFAPEPAEDESARRARQERQARQSVPARARSGGSGSGTPVATPRARDQYWPWDTGTGTGLGTGLDGLVDGRGLSSSTVLPVIEDDRVPGRSWLRLGAVLSVVVLLVVAVLVAVSLTQGPADSDGPEADPSGSSDTTAVEGRPLSGVTARAFDPLGTDGSENDDEAANAVDGDDATSWPTQSYNDQLGPPPTGLKTGVGLALDLGGEQTVTEVDVTLVGSPTRMALYLFDQDPSSVADAAPVAGTRAQGASATLSLEEPATASYAVVWLTSLPAEGSLFRGRVAEVVVQAAPRS